MIDTPAKQSDTAPDETPAYPHRKIWWIVGGTITAAALLFVMVVAGVWIWTASSPQEWTATEERFPGPVSHADVDVEIGDIDLAPASGTDLELSSHVTWRGAQPDPVEELHGTDFTARAGCDDGWGLFGGADDCRVDYTIALPAGTPAAAHVDVGHIHLDGLDGDVEASTDIGNVTGTGLRTTGLDVEVSVGDVDLEFAQVLGDIEVTADTGDVVIEVPDDGTTYAVQYESGVGEQHIDIATDPGAAADRIITVDAGVGDLTVRYTA